MIIACLSHKGGTGRTVTMANIGFRLAENGHSVCLVDLDLGSPTMMAALGQSTNMVGASDDSPGVHKYLSGQATFSRDHIIDLRREFNLQTDFHVVPGTLSGGDSVFTRDTLLEPLTKLLTTLDKQYEYVICDLRSGISNVFHALALLPNVGGPSCGWLLFYRSTPQHIEGLKDLIGPLGRSLERHTDEPLGVGLIRTASSDPDMYQDQSLRSFARERMTELSREEVAITRTSPYPSLLGVVPFEPILQWREGILTEQWPAARVVNHRTLESYRSIAGRVREFFPSS